MDKLVLIDTYAVLHRSFHAIPPLTNKRGELTNAIYGLVSILFRVVQDLKPSHIMFCLDEKAPTFRHKEYKEYQSQRPQMDAGLEGQIQKAKDVISAFNIPMYSKPGFEADDVIGTISQKAKKEMDVIVVTGDKDILQLVDDRVKVYMPVLGLSNGKMYSKIEVEEKLGIEPDLIPDYKALVGDPSDNYKGVPGIGPKTAVKLIEEYKNVKNIYKNLPKISQRVREKLEKGKESAFLSHKLATIVKDVSLKVDIEKSSKWSFNNKEVVKIFSNLNFTTLMERAKKIANEIEEEKQMKLL